VPLARRSNAAIVVAAAARRRLLIGFQRNFFARWARNGALAWRRAFFRRNAVFEMSALTRFSRVA
jgi:hypothetical protein